MSGDLWRYRATSRRHEAVRTWPCPTCRPSDARLRAIYLSLAIGETVALRPQGLQLRTATVVWCSAPSAGLLFENPLHPAVLDNLCRLNPECDGNYAEDLMPSVSIAPFASPA